MLLALLPTATWKSSFSDKFTRTSIQRQVQLLVSGLLAPVCHILMSQWQQEVPLHHSPLTIIFINDKEH
jgi:hypothetical protein